MSKILANSRDNELSVYGIVNQLDSWMNQNVRTTASPSFASLTVVGNTVVNGNLTVNGATTMINTDIITIKDNIILINSAEVGAGVQAGLSGIEVDRGTLTNYQFVFQESTQF